MSSYVKQWIIYTHTEYQHPRQSIKVAHKMHCLA